MASSKGARPILRACKTQISTHTSRIGLPGIMIIALGLFHFTSLPAAAGGTGLQPVTHLALPSVKPNKGLNLLQRPTVKPRPKTRRVSTLGNGSYICSPAGFGKRSHCFSN